MTSDHTPNTGRTLTISFVTDKAMSAYVMLPFDVPAKATCINLSYDYPKSNTCIIDLGLGNPDLTDFPSKGGLVGWSGGARSEIFIAIDAATPGYRPGIQDGT
jgi:hypothetical protein